MAMAGGVLGGNVIEVRLDFTKLRKQYFIY